MELQLTRGVIAVIDDEDASLVAACPWYPVANGDGAIRVAGFPYGTRAGRVYLHRFLAGVSDPAVWVDHRDGDGLNNRRSNLRVATPAQNAQNRRNHSNNSSGYRGVSLDRESGRFRAATAVAGRRVHIGRFATAEDAARAYDAAVIDLHGPFASTNVSLGLLRLGVG